MELDVAVVDDEGDETVAELGVGAGADAAAAAASCCAHSHCASFSIH